MFSDPVVGEDFFGRQEIIDLLVKRASALKSGYRQNVAIIGHRELGKTSLLRHFLHVFRDPQVLTLYVEIKLQALDYFVDQFIRSLLFQFLSPSGSVDSAEPLVSLTAKARPALPKTTARIDEIASLLKQRHAEEAYAKLFELTTIIKAETGKNCIVILDEFHRLGEFGVRNAFSDFGKRIMVQKDTMYLLSSSSFSASRKILAEKLTLLFGNFERIYLEPFDFETSFQFIEKKLAPLSVPQNLRSFLVSFTDGHPFFLETVTRRLKEAAGALSAGALTSELLKKALFELLYESQGVLNQYFLKLISPWTLSMARGNHVLILTQMARGNNKLKEIALASNRSQREISGELRDLMEHELILKSGVFYRFHDKIFKFWLREVYEKKELSLMGADVTGTGFLACLDKMLAEEEELARLDVSDRVLDLFSRFKNDLIEFGEKGRKLPHFTELVKTDSDKNIPGGKSRSLVAKGHGRCWICRITEGRATEKEVLDLVAGTKNNRAPHTKVLLALNGMEENAKLLAKENRILTLSLSRINLLMDLYGRSPIIRTHPDRRLTPLELR